MISKEEAFNLTQEQLKAQIKLLSTTRRKKYLRRKEVKYRVPGAKAFTPETFTQFIQAHKPHEWRYQVMWMIDATLGLRISELLDLKKNDFDFQHKTVCIRTLKQKSSYEVRDFLPLNPMLEELIQTYLMNYEEEVNAHNGFIFFSQCHGKNISSAFARKIFRKVCNRAGLTQVYGEREAISTPVLANKNKGNLYFLSPHSIRHCYGRHVALLFQPTIAMGLLRLKSWNVFNTYTSARYQEIQQAGQTAFPRPTQ